MKGIFLIPVFALPLLGSCDHLDSAGGKSKDASKEDRHRLDGVGLREIANGIENAGPTIQDIGEVDFKTFIYDPIRLNVVNFHTEDSDPCKQLDPVLTGIIDKNCGVARLGRLEVQQARELAMEQGVTRVPDVRFYINGKLVHKFTGAESKKTIEKLVATHTADIDPATGMAARPYEGFQGMAEHNGTTATVPRRPRPPNAKPIEEAVKPMEKEWRPPGVIRK